MASPQTTSAEAFAQHVPGTLLATGSGPAWTDVLIEVYARRRTETCLVVPAVAEPLVVLILAGRAFVEEREFGGPWTGRTVCAGEFFLTTTPTPYELRWPGDGSRSRWKPCTPTWVCLCWPARSRKCGASRRPACRHCGRHSGSGTRCSPPSWNCSAPNCSPAPAPGPLFVQGIAQSLALHLVRTYPVASHPPPSRRGGMPAFRLRQVTALLEAHLDENLPLARLAQAAGYSPFHFSRLFKQTTGFAPSRYLIRLRMARARRLLRETTGSMIEIGLEVGYPSPSHFAHAFQREVGVTPSEYRRQGLSRRRVFGARSRQAEQTDASRPKRASVASSHEKD